MNVTACVCRVCTYTLALRVRPGCSILSLTCIIALTCCGNLARQVPTNYVLLLLFTLAEGYLVATVSSYYTAESVVLAVGITAAITLGLTVFAFQVHSRQHVSSRCSLVRVVVACCSVVWGFAFASSSPHCCVGLDVRAGGPCGRRCVGVCS